MDKTGGACSEVIVKFPKGFKTRSTRLPTCGCSSWMLYIGPKAKLHLVFLMLKVKWKLEGIFCATVPLNVFHTFSRMITSDKSEFRPAQHVTDKLVAIKDAVRDQVLRKHGKRC